VLGMGIGSVALIDMNKSGLPLVMSLIIILSSAPIAYAMFLTPVEIIDSTGDGGGNLLDAPFDVATDSSGNVFVSGNISDNVFKITPGGIITEIIDSTGDGIGNLLNSPTGIATDSSGNVFVAGSSSVNAFKITPGGIITEIIDSTGDGIGNVLVSPREITTDSSGNVFVPGTGSDNVFKITPGGTITEIIDAIGDGGGNTLSGPFAVATDSSGNVFVVGVGSDNAFKIELDLGPIIGGTSIPINTTALLIAGFNANSMWMIPVVVAGIAIGVFMIKRRK